MRMIPTAALLLGWIVLGFVVTVAWNTPSLDWFPSEYAAEFFYLKGALSLIGTLMLIRHMRFTWPGIHRWAQRLRYLALLYLSVLLTYASVRQARDVPAVEWAHFGGIIGAVVLIVAMAFSLRADYRAAAHN